MGVYKEKPLKVNMILNAVKGIMSMAFSLITFPYVSKVLGVETLGRYNFAASIISYFVLTARLGIGLYAIREGARIREDKKEINKFVNEMFSINCISTIISYMFFLIALFYGKKLKDYRMILFVLSGQIVLHFIGVEWLYSIYEEYLYITLRTVFFQLISLVLLLVFVKTENDVTVYAAIMVISNAGTGIMNYLHSRKYCRIKLTKNIEWKKHLKPIMILFALCVTTTIYVDSDITLLGFICGDYVTGIYSVSTKVYTMVKVLLSSILIVSVPRLSSLLGEGNKERYIETAEDVSKTLLSVLIPAIVGIIVLRNEIVQLISGQEYIQATFSLALLSVALFFCFGAWFWQQCVLVPMKEEKIVFKATILSAVVNLFFNLIFIPFWKENAAAITTIMAEAIAFLWCWWHGRKRAKITGMVKLFLKSTVGCFSIPVVSYLVHGFNLSSFLNVVLIVPCSVVTYVLIEVLVRNEVVQDTVTKLKNQLTHRAG